MRIITLSIAVLLLGASLGVPTTKAASISAGDLIKASGPAVYYFSSNGKRYVFPTERTYKTWYQDFSSVKTITDAELGALTIGGNVTYKPGVKLVKITTDPRTYAVSTGGTLRHVATEQIAVALYGADWNTKIDDIPDAFFINYRLGSAVNAASEFSPSQLTSLAVNIDTDKTATVTPPTPCTTNCNTTTTTPPMQPQVTLTLSKATVRPGDIQTLQVTTSDADKQIRLYFDNTLIMTCNNTNQCNGDAAVPITADKEIYEARAVAMTLDGTEYTATKSMSVDRSAQSDVATIRADRTSVRDGQATGVTVEVQNVVVSRIDIHVDGSAVKVCQSGIRLCQWSQTYTGSIGTAHTVYGIVQDSIGRTYRTNDLTISITANDAPMVTVAPGKPTIFKGETVDIAVSADDENGIQKIEVLDSNKVVLKTCTGAAPCTYVTGQNSEAGTLTFFGKATDMLGATGERSATVTVQ